MIFSNRKETKKKGEITGGEKRNEEIAKDAVAESFEVVLDNFAKYFLNSDMSKIVSEIPVVASVRGLLAIASNVRNWRIARNISFFVRGLQLDEVDQEKYEELVRKYGRNKIIEQVLISMDMMRSEKQAIALSCLFNALVRGDLGWQRFSELQNILEKIDPSALDEERTERPSYKFVSVGLAYVQQTTEDGTRSFGNGKLLNDYEQYVAEPYRKKRKIIEASQSE